MRIGFDVSALVKEAAGIGQYIINVLKNIMDMKTEHEFYLFSYDEIKIPFELPDGWHMVYYGGSQKKQIRYLTHMSKYLKQYKIDILVGTRHYLPLFHPKGIRYVAIVHDLIPLYMPELFTKKHKLRFRIFTEICRRQADFIVTISNATRQDIIRYMKFPEDRIAVVYEGASPMFSPKRDFSGIRRTMQKYEIDSNYILCLSTVEPRKNMLRTIQAYEQCLREHSLAYKLVIVGGSGWNNGAIYDYVQQSESLQKQVIFTGYVSEEEKIHIYANASLFIYASLCEGFGLPVLEAMQSGIPVITSNVSCMPEVAGDACELVNPFQVEELQEAIVHVLSSEELRSDMVKKGLERSKLFSWKKCAEETFSYIINSTPLH